MFCSQGSCNINQTQLKLIRLTAVLIYSIIQVWVSFFSFGTSFGHTQVLNISCSQEGFLLAYYSDLQ